MSIDNYLTLNFSGVPSIITTRHRLVTGIVVTITRIAKIYVQIGSQIHASGRKYIIIAAIITPIDWIQSPRTCNKAESIFKLPDYKNLLFLSFLHESLLGSDEGNSVSLTNGVSIFELLYSFFDSVF